MGLPTWIMSHLLNLSMGALSPWVHSKENTGEARAFGKKASKEASATGRVYADRW